MQLPRRGTLPRVTRPLGPDEELVLAASLVAPARARDHLAQVFAGWGRNGLEAAQLLVTELVTNAVRHGAGPVRVQTRILDDRLHVGVADDGEGQPSLQQAPTLAMGGRGLYIVNALADRWGVERSIAGPGKTVWFEIGSR